MAQIQINLRTDDALRVKAEAIFNELGLGMSTAFNMFLQAVVREGGISFIPLNLTGERLNSLPAETVRTNPSAGGSHDFNYYIAEMELRVRALPKETDFDIRALFNKPGEIQDIGRQKIAGNLGKYLNKHVSVWGARWIPGQLNPARYTKIENPQEDEQDS